jgi:hypothetical protein
MSEIELFGPKYLQRQKHDRDAITKMRNGETSWVTNNGDYQGRIYLEQGDSFQFTSERGEIAAGYLSFLAKNLDEQLKASPDKPVIAIDVGGHDGKSWRDLAKYFHKEVAEGKIVFVVSNMEINFEPLETETNGVIFLNDSTDEMIRDQIDTPKGKVPLKGNVNFVHERLSVSKHSIVPERDVANLASLVSDTGIYFSGNQFAGGYLIPKGYTIHEKQIALDMSREDVQSKAKLQYVKAIEDGPNKGRDFMGYVLKAPNAPELYG